MYDKSFFRKTFKRYPVLGFVKKNGNYELVGIGKNKTNTNKMIKKNNFRGGTKIIYFKFTLLLDEVKVELSSSTITNKNTFRNNKKKVLFYLDYDKKMINRKVFDSIIKDNKKELIGGFEADVGGYETFFSPQEEKQQEFQEFQSQEEQRLKQQNMEKGGNLYQVDSETDSD